MPKVKDIFNFDNPIYAPLRNPSREVIKAYQDANRYFDTTQEYVYIEQGMKYLSKIIHEQAHEFPKRIDSFIDMLRGTEVPNSTPQAARYAVAAGIMGAKSIRNNSMPYDVPALSEELENFDFSLNK